MSSPDPAIPADADLDAAILRAEWKRRMLERLAEVGMELVEQVGSRAAARPEAWAGEGGERREDCAKAFAQVSRAVRLTLALHTQIEQEILALRKGERPALAPAFRAADPRRAERTRARGAVFAAVDHAVGDRDHAFEVLDRAEAGLSEGAEFEAFLKLPFRDCVAAICADLGVDPHWSRWSDWEGFVDSADDPGLGWAGKWRARPGPDASPAHRPGLAQGRAAQPARVAALE